MGFPKEEQTKQAFVRTEAQRSHVPTAELVRAPKVGYAFSGSLGNQKPPTVLSRAADGNVFFLVNKRRDGCETPVLNLSSGQLQRVKPLSICTTSWQGCNPSYPLILTRLTKAHLKCVVALLRKEVIGALSVQEWSMLKLESCLRSLLEMKTRLDLMILLIC